VFAHLLAPLLDHITHETLLEMRGNGNSFAHSKSTTGQKIGTVRSSATQHSPSQIRVSGEFFDFPRSIGINAIFGRQFADHPAPVNCATAEGDLRIVKSENTHVGEQNIQGATPLWPARAALVKGIFARALSLRHTLSPATKNSEPSIDEVTAWKESQRGSASHPQLSEIAQDILVGRIDHQAATEVANALRLEAERQMYAGQVAIQRGVEEFLSRCLAAQFQGLIEASLVDGETQAIERSLARTGRLETLRGMKVFERRVIAVVVHRDHSPVEVLVGSGTSIHLGAPLPTGPWIAGRAELSVVPTPLLNADAVPKVSNRQRRAQMLELERR